MTPLSLSNHAIRRWQQRVDPHISATEARLALGRFIALGRVRSTPRHWMRDDVTATPGLMFVYCAARPGVCALIQNGTVLTVITRALCSSPTSRRHLRLVPSGPVCEPAPRWRWNGDLGEAA